MKAFFPRIAAVNLAGNKTAYLPYLLTSSVCVATFYIMLTFAISPEMARVPYATGAVMLFGFGTVIIAIFCAALLFYANSFLIRRRKKEFGLYSVLGMEKRHVGVVLFFETLYTLAASLILGLIGGTLLSQLLFGALSSLLSFDVVFSISFCDAAAIAACILFGGLFAVIFLYNLLHLYQASPVSLLHGEQTGEREPRASWILTIIGLAALGGGYTIAVVRTNAVTSIPDFFLAVLLVIIGTFCLFTSGSIKFLKALKRSKRFYYKPENFISLSGMLFRMKRNAAGLASICILFTMLLVTVSTTLCLYLGRESSLQQLYPTAVTAFGEASSLDDVTEALNTAESIAQENGAELTRSLVFRSGTLVFTEQDGTLVLTQDGDEADHFVYATIVPAEDYAALSGEEVVLEPNEFLLASSSLSQDTVLSLNGTEYRCAGEADALNAVTQTGLAGMDMQFAMIVCRDAENLLTSAGGSLTGFNGYFDVTGGDEAETAFAEAIASSGCAFSYASSRADVAQEWYALYGCFLFLGLFFGALFLMATGLIIYYKQLSEGFDDSTRFAIMQKVGLSPEESRRAIRRQILLVFFLPLAAAALHLVFAYNIICNILLILGVTDRMLFACLCAATFVLCAAVYYLIYRLTSRTYSRLVRA